MTFPDAIEILNPDDTHKRPKGSANWPGVEGRTDRAPVPAQAGAWGSILPAVWSFMLAARARGVGTVWTTAQGPLERELAKVLGVPFEEVILAAFIPLAFTLGTDFKPAPRIPRKEVLHWEPRARLPGRPDPRAAWQADRTHTEVPSPHRSRDKSAGPGVRSCRKPWPSRVWWVSVVGTDDGRVSAASEQHAQARPDSGCCGDVAGRALAMSRYEVLAPHLHERVPLARLAADEGDERPRPPGGREP